MKVLTLSNLYPPDFTGGYELACSQAVDGMLARGHNVRVMCGAPRRPVPHVPHVHCDFRIPDIYNDYLMQNLAATTRDSWMADSRYVCAHNVHALTTMLDEFQPDVVYVCNLLGLGGLGIMAALDYLKYPWIWQLGDHVPVWLCEVGHQINPVLLSSLHRIRGEFISVSGRLANRIKSFGFEFPGPVHFIPNWISGEQPARRTHFYKPGDPLRLIAAGQMSRHKGVGILIESMALLRDWGYENITADLYGHSVDHSWQAMIHAHRLESQVKMCGIRPQAELLKIYADYDAFLFPTHEDEPFGLTPLEALAQECVPILARECGVAEWLVHGVHCLKADRTAHSFASMIRSIFEGEVELKPIASRGAAATWRDFHISTYLDKLDVILDSSAAKSRHGAGTSGEAYRLALLGEKLVHLMMDELQAA